MAVTFHAATPTDAPALATLHTAVADHLTLLHGRGPWSSKTSEKGVLFAMRTSPVIVATDGGGAIVGTFRLATKKPWAIDVKYFTPCGVGGKPLYLLSMAVQPARQAQGIGRQCMEEAARLARAWPAAAIRLDAYDGPAGAGGFYARCGCVERGRITYRNAPLIYYELLLER
jgi:GNAT superfamily N-acetyltransferase